MKISLKHFRVSGKIPKAQAISRRRGEYMPRTTVRENESLDDALRRFKRQVNKAAIIAECKKHDAYLKPGLRRKMKSEAARRKGR